MHLVERPLCDILGAAAKSLSHNIHVRKTLIYLFIYLFPTLKGFTFRVRGVAPRYMHVMY